MADKLYRHKKTGEQKHLPEPVFKAVQKHWQLVEEQEATPEPKRPAPQEPAPVVTPQAPETTDPEPSKEDLQTEYEKLYGDKPDGRWNVKKLQEKIQEKKDQ